MSAPFNVGDVVEMKSGGPHMTVEKGEGGTVYCAWFDGKDVKRGHFPPGMLKKVEEWKG